MRSLGWLGGAGLLAALLAACAVDLPLTPSAGPSHAQRPDVAARPPSLAPGVEPAAPEPDYLNYVAYRSPLDEWMLLRWPASAMPLRVHLPTPPQGLVSDPTAAREAVRLGVLGWKDIVAPGIPSFVFVERARDADIPIVWANEPRGWFIASCRYQIDVLRRRLDVSQLMVTGRWRGGEETPLPQLEAATLHEMGHALGLTGHSPHPRDVMYKYVTQETRARLSPRDRATLRELYSRPNGAPMPASSSVVY